MPSATLAASLSFALTTSGIALGAGQEDRRTPHAKAVLVSQLDATLPKISLDQWMSALARSGISVQWTSTNCPATYSNNDPRYPICVVARAESVGGRVAAVSVWLGEGRLENWGTPRVEEIFIDTAKGSLTVQRLSELPAALRLPPARWNKPELRVDEQSVRCVPRAPTAGASVTCEVVIHNDGGAGTAATLYLNPFIEGNDACCPGGRWQGAVAANGSIRPQIKFQWPNGGSGIGVRVFLVTPSGWGGHRSPTQEATRRTMPSTCGFHCRDDDPSRARPRRRFRVAEREPAVHRQCAGRVSPGPVGRDCTGAWPRGWIFSAADPRDARRGWAHHLQIRMKSGTGHGYLLK